MLWLYLVLIAVNLWSASNLIDKHVIGKYMRKPEAGVVILGFVGLAAAVPAFLFAGTALPLWLIPLAFLSGLAFIASLVLYFKAIKIEEITRVASLMYLMPLFIMILAAIFLNEVFSLPKYAGIVMMVSGALLISYRRGGMASKALIIMIFAALAGSLSSIMGKYMLGFADYWSVFAWTRVGNFAGSLFILYLYFPELARVYREHGKKPLAFLASSDTLATVGLLLSTIAVSMAAVTMVTALQAIQPLFVLIYATIISVYKPHIIREEVSAGTILLKITAIIFMLAGTYLIGVI